MISAALMCLALNVYHESRSEPLQGQAAVAHVVLNRVASGRWPDDVYCDGKPDEPTEILAWAKSVLVANQVLTGVVPDVTNGATHYHARYVNPYWSASLSKTVTYGSHLFYR
jgi:N-acetylmuramoyl-L-alanine amidase